MTSSTGLLGVNGEDLSTFRSKDPFIQQAVPPSTTTTTAAPTASTTTSTTVYVSSTTTTLSVSTTSTTAAHTHSLKILEIRSVSGQPAVTFKVDATVYKDKRVGDVVSTSWGQVKILDISTTSMTVTLLHGSETLTLLVGQEVYE
ncbi:MAG: hypothetical protein H5T84_01285 [Thermoleophilia bacterium]|nr:hypothetical protein [Thermoleophilia bacterium]